jgi:hypothetical protein
VTPFKGEAAYVPDRKTGAGDVERTESNLQLAVLEDPHLTDDEGGTLSSVLETT